MNNLVFGLGVAGVGMLVVFVGLVILIAFISLLAVFSSGKKAKKKPEKTETKAAAIPVPAPVAPVVAAQGIPDDVLAAITAAIACVWDGEKRFVVRHVKRISNAPAWNRAGREEQTYSRF